MLATPTLDEGRVPHMTVIKLEPDLEEAFNRHDFWRGCYATMLAELKLEHIKEFFDSVPMVMGGRRIGGAKLFNLFWIEKGLVLAKILRSFLHAFTLEGKRDFEYREFKRDFEIGMGMKNSNFEVRFYRLIEKLEEKYPDFKIVKSDRGRFSAESGCKILLEDL